MHISRIQISAAMSLLDMTQANLAEATGISKPTISNFLKPSSVWETKESTKHKIVGFLSTRGIEFIENDGVKKRTNEVRKLNGKDAMSDFLDDVYQMIVDTGTPYKPTQLFMYNVKQTNWTKWMGKERWENHCQRMTARKECIDCRTMLKEGDNYFPSAAWTDYKWFPEEIFSDKTFYSYGSKLAFLQFFDHDMEVIIMDNADFTEGYNNLFLIAWNSIATKPDIK